MANWEAPTNGSPEPLQPVLVGDRQVDVIDDSTSDERADKAHRLSPFDLKRITGGAPFYPLFVLFLFNLIDGLDVVAFTVLLPEIRDEFRLSNEGVLALAALSAPAALVFALVIGYYGDRVRRVPLVLGAGATWGGFSLLTGVAPNAPVMAAGRAGTGLGRTVNSPVHQSLIADYYPPAARPKVYGFYSAANSVALVVGPVVAGALAVSLGWRAPFIVFAVATGVIIVLALGLREPVRGRYDRLAAGASEETADTEAKRPASFGESWRLLYTVATVRRLYFTVPIVSASITAISQTQSLYYSRVFGADAFDRGFLIAVVQPFAILGLIVGSPIAARLMARDPAKALGFLRYPAIGSAAAIGVFAVAPTLPIAVVAAMVQAGLAALLLPAVLSALSLVMPPRGRSLGFAVLGLWFIPGLALLPVIGRIGDLWGFRTALLVFVPIYLLGWYLLSTTAQFINADVANNLRYTVVESEAQIERIRFREAVERGDLDESEFALLEARDIHFSYGSLKVLFGVGITIPRQGRVAVLGPNGAGKSTLLDVISGLNTPDVGTGGTVWFEQDDITFMLPEERLSRGIVQIGGGQATFPTLSVEENLRIGGYRYLGDRTLVDERMEEAFEMFPVLRERRGQRAGTLSGGEQQMMALGRALIAEPRLLIIDELSLGLAPIVMHDVIRMVEEIADRGTSILLVEQSLNIALSLTDHAYLLEKGEITFSGPTRELGDASAIAQSLFLGQGASR